MLIRQLVSTEWFMDKYERETQLSVFGKVVEVVVMAPDNLSKWQQRDFRVDNMLDFVVKIINDRDSLSDAFVIPLLALHSQTYLHCASAGEWSGCTQLSFWYMGKKTLWLVAFPITIDGARAK